MRRAALALPFVLGLAAAGAFSTRALPAGTSGTVTTPTTTAATAPTIAPDVRIGGVRVGGLTADEATEAVEAHFDLPLIVIIRRHRLAPTPQALGARAKIAGAVARALTAPPGTAVRLFVQVDGSKVRRFVTAVARRFDRPAVESRLYLRDLRPYLTPERTGLRLPRLRAVQTIVSALVANRRRPVRLVQKVVRPEVTRRDFGPVIVIRRGSNQLYFYRGMRFGRRFGVATGQRIYPTPLGRFTIVVKWRNPWWYPPPSPWARGLKPVPPGPGNPLGTRWMGLSAAGVGIHGTPDAGSIGYSVSHGCIRMRIPDAEWLFTRVSIGTPVFIVAA